jgi:prepilin-type N-terminal cleavage/methylation domain-containing protein
MRDACHEADKRRWVGRFGENRSGFSLIELLVAIAVLSILTLLLCGILNQVSSSWTQIRAQVDWRQNGRSILNVIASELRVAALPVDRSSPYSLQLMVDPNALLGNSTYLNPHAIFWQAPIASDTSLGNMAEVGYFVRWDSSNATNPRAVLCRFFVNPKDTANYLIYSNPTAWLTTGSSGTLDTVAPGNTANNYKGWFADNVIGLWVRCLDANGIPITRTAADVAHLTDSVTTNYSFDSRLGYLATNAGTSGSYIAKSAYYDAGITTSAGTHEMVQSALPSTIEIAIVLIDSQTANRVTAIPSYTPFPSGVSGASSPYINDSPVDFWNDINYFLSKLKTAQPLVARGAHVYSIRVPLVNGG